MSGATQADVVVVGGGHNGLVAAAYLARTGLDVLVLERAERVGGAVAGAEVFPGVAARLSRYSYLVSLLPERIVRELDLRVRLRSRATASYTPTTVAGTDGGLLVERADGPATAASFAALTGSADEHDRWRAFSADLQRLASAVEPTLLEPLPRRAQLRARAVDAAGAAVWDAVVERPVGEVLERTFAHDLVRGTALTDALIGTHTHAHDETLLANRVFLYHVVGGGTGEWKVPVGGMGAVADALEHAARTAGAAIRCSAEVVHVDAGDRSGTVTWRDATGAEHAVTARHVLAGVAPEVLSGLRGATPPRTTEGSQLKVNMVLEHLPRLRSGVDPRLAFAGTLHVDEGYDQLEAAYRAADAGALPATIPSEVYCHTLTDDSILAPPLARAGWHTLTVFALHTPARLFRGEDAGAVRAEATARVLAGLDRYLVDPVESCLATDADGRPCLEASSPVDLERQLGLPGGHIFHGDLQWPFADAGGPGADGPDDRWGVATDAASLLLCGSGARRGGAVSGIAGHNAAQAVLERTRGRGSAG